MKKIQLLFYSAVLAGGLFFSVAAYADGGSYVSNGQVEFETSDDPTDPVDPENPGEPVNPVDPTDPNGPNPGTQGPLSIDFASSLDFGKQMITSKNQVYKVAPQKYLKQISVDQNGDPVYDTTPAEGPNYVQITDNRGLESGWTLQLTQTAQFKNGTNELTGAQIHLKAGQVVTNAQSPAPTPSTETDLVPGNAAVVMSAKQGEGAGTYLNTWGQTKADAPESIQLSVPGSTTKYKGMYTTHLSWILSDVPGN